MRPTLIVVAVIVIAGIAGSILFFTPSTPITQSSDFRLEYSRKGGIAGMDEKLVIEADGAASFTSNRREPYSTKLDTPVFDDLKGLISRNVDKVPSTAIKAVSGAADYFEYTITVKANGKAFEFSWVDEGAAQAKIPETLNLIHSRIVIVQESLIK